MKIESLVTTIDFEPDYLRQGGKLKVTILQNLPLPGDFVPREQSIVDFEPGATGGNHKHPRTEIFYVHRGELSLYWTNGQGKTKKMKMGPSKNKNRLFVIPPFVPHAVVNESEKPAVLVELANEPQADVQKVDLV